MLVAARALKVFRNIELQLLLLIQVLNVLQLIERVIRLLQGLLLVLNARKSRVGFPVDRRAYSMRLFDEVLLHVVVLVLRRRLINPHVSVLLLNRLILALKQKQLLLGHVPNVVRANLQPLEYILLLNILLDPFVRLQRQKYVRRQRVLRADHELRRLQLDQRQILHQGDLQFLHLG